MNRHGKTSGDNLKETAKYLLSAVVLLALGGVWNGAWAQACQTPLFIQEGQVEANVMILFDNSGSMNEAMYHEEYDPGVNYPGDYNNGWIYFVNAEANYMINGRVARLVTGPGGFSGRYIGNYLNWIFWQATLAQRGSIPLDTRMDVAHEVMYDIIDRSNGVRFGIANFNVSDGGFINQPCGTDKDDVRDEVLTIVGNTWTPLAETMEDVLDYFTGDGGSDPIQAKCQQNFMIVMTDGFPTMDRNISGYLHDADNDGNDPGNCASIGAPYGNGSDCSDHMDDVAYYMRHNDLRNDFGENGESWEDGQNVVTYTVGFGIDASLLQETADNGDGLYLVASDAAELWTSLELVMLDIISRISSGAAVAVVSTERGDEDYLYRGKFMPGEWTGFLEAFELPYETGDIPVWEAGYLLSQRSSASRTIFSAVNGTTYSFTTANAGDLNGAMNVTEAEAVDLINWVRGSWVAGLRERPDNWKLGDIIHSTPVVVGEPSAYIMDQDYQAFALTWTNRDRTIYVGGNDGMLHAFDTDTGAEKWAFVPEFGLEALEDIADPNYCHQYTCDLTPSVKDVYFNGAWRTVLVTGARDGGASYFALDVTDPSAPLFMWEMTLDNGLAGSSEVEFAVIEDIPVLLIGSGLDPDGVAYLYVHDLETGVERGSLELSSAGVGNRNKATGVTAVDVDWDDADDLCYVADLQGIVHRIDFDGSVSVNDWNESELYSGSEGISAKPVAAFGDGNKVNVYFGTGAYLEGDDILTLEDHTFFCVFDAQDGAENPSLVDQTNGINDIGNDDGWYIDLPNEGERVTEPAVVVAGAVFFTSYLPSSEVCEAGGHSWLYRVAYDDGSVPDDGEDDGFEGDRSMDMGEGIASRPVVDIVNESVIVQSSDATITIEDIGQVFFHLKVKSWQENHNDANTYVP